MGKFVNWKRLSVMLGFTEPDTLENQLEMACERNDLETVKSLLNNRYKYWYQGALLIASERGYLEIVKLVHCAMMKGALWDSGVSYCIDAAIINDHYDVADYLCETYPTKLGYPLYIPYSHECKMPFDKFIILVKKHDMRIMPDYCRLDETPLIYEKELEEHYEDLLRILSKVANNDLLSEIKLFCNIKTE